MIESNQLITSVAVEPILSFPYGNFSAIWIIELSKSIWYSTTAILLVSLAEKSTVIFSDREDVDYTVVSIYFSI